MAGCSKLYTLRCLNSKGDKLSLSIISAISYSFAVIGSSSYSGILTRFSMTDFAQIELYDAIRYMFKSTERAALQEIGPRFTLKLKYIKKGVPAVHQLGAAPPPLQFDEDNEDGEEEENKPATKTPGAAAAPAKDEEYIWQWKVRFSFEVASYDVVFIDGLLVNPHSPNWRLRGRRSSYNRVLVHACASFTPKLSSSEVSPSYKTPVCIKIALGTKFKSLCKYCICSSVVA